jgi:hypothetical protein
MAKKLFKNYDFEFDKNEAKIITSFCKQAGKQMMSDERFANDVRAFNSIIEKIDADPFSVKMSKDEKTRLVRQLTENVKHIEKEMGRTNFLKRWLMKSMYKQYTSLLTNHFSE